MVYQENKDNRELQSSGVCTTPEQLFRRTLIILGVFLLDWIPAELGYTFPCPSTAEGQKSESLGLDYPFPEEQEAAAEQLL